MAFNSALAPGSPEFGLLYIGVADGGSGGDPMRQAQDRASAFGKLFRIDPLGNNSPNGKYGIPASNPFVGTAGVLPENLCLRHPERPAFRVGSAERQPVSLRHRPEHRREGDPRPGRRQPRVERLGGQLPVHQSCGRQHREPFAPIPRSPIPSWNGGSQTRCCRPAPPLEGSSSTAATRFHRSPAS